MGLDSKSIKNPSELHGDITTQLSFICLAINSDDLPSSNNGNLLRQILNVEESIINDHARLDAATEVAKL